MDVHISVPIQPMAARGSAMCRQNDDQERLLSSMFSWTVDQRWIGHRAG